MAKLKVIEAFKWAHGGHTVKEYAKGDVIDTKEKGVCVNEDDAADLERVSLHEKWTKKDGKEEATPPAPAPAPAPAP